MKPKYPDSFETAVFDGRIQGPNWPVVLSDPLNVRFDPRANKSVIAPDLPYTPVVGRVMDFQDTETVAAAMNKPLS